MEPRYTFKCNKCHHKTFKTKKALDDHKRSTNVTAHNHPGFYRENMELIISKEREIKQEKEKKKQEKKKKKKAPTIVLFDDSVITEEELYEVAFYDSLGPFDD